MKTNISPQARRRGMTYATVIVTFVVMGTVLAAYLKTVGVQNQLSVRSQTWNRSVPVLEAGVEEAMAHLNKNGSPDAAGNVDLTKLATDGWWAGGGSPTGPWYKFNWVGSDFYFVSISSWNGNTATFPMINSTGYVRQLPAYSFKRGGPFFLAASAYSGYSARVVNCTTTNNPTFSKGIVARFGINMNGNNVTVDSYDSGNTSKSTDGRWDPSKRGDKGDVASNDTITNTINVGNANIYGRVATGPNGTVYIGPNGRVGSLNWHATGNNGRIEPGWSTDDMNVEFPDVVLPAGSFGWVPPASTTLTSGDYRVAGNWSGQILIRSNSNVRIRIDGALNLSGQDGITIEQNANVKIYLNGSSSQITGKGIINTAGTPNQCYIFGTSNLRSLDIGGNGEMTAVVYAPYASMKLHGSGSGDQDFSGALVANDFTFTGHYNVHYDEALGRNGLWRGFTITSWNEK